MSDDQLKKFVSEKQLDDDRQRRQEEWQRVRKPDDPPTKPDDLEPPIDNRTLYDKLQEQKNATQEEREEKLKMKNLFRGIDDDEAHFLDQVESARQQDEMRLQQEELDELKRFRSEARSKQQLVSSSTSSASTSKPRVQVAAIPSQKRLLAHAVKRKAAPNPIPSARKVIAYLPGIASYEEEDVDESDRSSSASSDSSNDNNDPDPSISGLTILMKNQEERKRSRAAAAKE